MRRRNGDRWDRSSVVFIVNRPWTRRPGNRGSIPGRVKGLFFLKVSMPLLGPTQRPVEWVLVAPSPVVKRTADFRPVRKISKSDY